MLTRADYEKAVREYCRIKEEKEDLSLVLINPTPSALRDECEAVCQRRFGKEDRRALSLFFGEKADQAAFLEEIYNFKLAKFKPLIKYLKGGSKNTQLKNVELLAWLIDFQPRPLDRYKNSQESPVIEKIKPKDASDENTVVAVIPEFKEDEKTEKVILVEDEPIEGEDEPVCIPAELAKRTFNVNLWKAGAVVAMLAGVIIGTRFYTIRTNKPPMPVPTGKEACMFWNEDHYEPISCAAKPDNGALVIGLDSERLIHFKKINRADTLTEASKGKVWVTKYRGKAEFYTDSGLHPIDPGFRLRPASPHMIDRYAHLEQ